MTLDEQISKLGFGEKQKTETIISKYLLANAMSSSEIKNTYFRIKKPTESDETFEEFSEVHALELTEKHSENITEAFLRAGLIKTTLVFWEDGDNDYEYDNLDDDEFNEILLELNKSKVAADKYTCDDDYKTYSGSDLEDFHFGTREDHNNYNQERGEVYHPDSGAGGFDPLLRVSKRYSFTDKVRRDPEYVVHSACDLEKARDALTPPELKVAINKLAKKLAVERLEAKS